MKTRLQQNEFAVARDQKIEDLCVGVTGLEVLTDENGQVMRQWGI